MKIAFIANWFPGLSETFILNQVTGLIDRGHDVAIFANGPSKQPMTHADFKRYRLAERTFYYGDTYVHFPDNKIDRVKKLCCWQDIEPENDQFNRFCGR